MRYLGFFLLTVLTLAFRTEDPLFSYPKQWPKPVYAFRNNPLTAQKIALGRALFYDPRLSHNNSISCASCHSPYSAFTHVDHALSHGINDSIGTRNSPALMNLAWQSSFMWDGAVNHLDVQALAPLAHPKEMGSSIAELVARLRASAQYRRLFAAAYGDSIATGERTLKALSQFMLTLVSANAKYDRVQLGTDQFTAQEQNGYRLFKTHCNACHTEPLFSNYLFADNGLPIDPSLNDYGRLHITQNPTDSFKFKTPTLRNVEYSYPYMHDGRFTKLAQVIEHYSRGIRPRSSLATPLRSPIVLSSNDKVDLIAFLLTLSDREFVFDKRLGPPERVVSER